MFTHDWRACWNGGVLRLRPEMFPEVHPPAEDVICLGAEGPQLVRRPGLFSPGGAASLISRSHRLAPAESVQPAQRREPPNRKPGDDERREGGGLDFPAFEPRRCRWSTTGAAQQHG